jgi:hypothetical protein
MQGTGQETGKESRNRAVEGTQRKEERYGIDRLVT